MLLENTSCFIKDVFDFILFYFSFNLGKVAWHKVLMLGNIAAIWNKLLLDKD